MNPPDQADSHGDQADSHRDQDRAQAPNAGPGTGLCCRHCHVPGSHAHGCFRTRDGSTKGRFRCPACRRTWSEATYSVGAYLKKPDAWQQVPECMTAGLTLRQMATRLGVHLATAFRWRHLVLATIQDRPRPQCGGIVEAGLTAFQYSKKGNHHQGDKAEATGLRSGHWETWWPISVLLLRDRQQGSGAVVLGRALRGWPLPEDAEELAREHMAPGAILCAAAAGAQMRGLCKKMGMALRVANRHGKRRDKEYHTRNLDRFRVQLLRWMRRFRGVATHYLQRYLTWFVEEAGGRPVAVDC